MNSLTIHTVVDRMAAQLAERRRNSIYRSSAYLALARAILSDEQVELRPESAFERVPVSISRSQAA